MPIQGSKAGADEKSKDLFLRMRWLSPAQQQKFLADLNDDQLKGLLAYLYDGGEKDPRVAGARDVASRAARDRGINIDEARKSKAPKAPKGKSGGSGGGKSGGGSKGKSSGGKSSGSGSKNKSSGSGSSGSSSSKKKTTSSSTGSGTSTAKPKPPTAPGPPSRRVSPSPGDGATPGVPKR